MEAAQATWRPLGELIVERGLVTQEQLEDALLEQRVTRRRLGSILIDRGIVSAQELTDALVDQIGVEELLDEFDRAEEVAQPDGSVTRQNPLGRFVTVFAGVVLAVPRSLARPAARVRAKAAGGGRRAETGPLVPIGSVSSGQGENGVVSEDASFEDRIAFFTGRPPAEPVRDAEPEQEPEPEPEPHADAEPAPDDAAVPGFGVAPPHADVELETFEFEAVDAEPEIAEPEPEIAEPEPEIDAEPEPDWTDASASDAPRVWLSSVRTALEQAEIELARLDENIAAHALALEEAHSALAERDSELSRESAARALAEDEVARLMVLIDERDAGLTALEGTVEEMRAIGTATQSELDQVRERLEGVSGELDLLHADVAGRKNRIAELEAQLAEFDRRGDRIAELEARVSELAESLSATDETLGIEMHAREQAQRESKRLRDELDEREALLVKLGQQVETLEAELEAAVAEREQVQRKLRSREERMTRLEGTLTDLRAERDAEAARSATEPEPAPDAPGAEPVAPAEQIVAAAERVTPAEPVSRPAAPASEPRAEGFLYFVPRPGNGYALVEQTGEAPPVGERVEVEGTSFEVTRHSRSPLPFDRRVCAYLRAS